MTVTVRPARPEDVSAVQRIAHAGWRAAYGDFLDDDTLEHVRETWHTRETFRRSVERTDVPFFVACERDDAGEDGGDAGAADADDADERVVGYASGGFPDDAAHAVVGTLYVDPLRWGEGYGTALFERVLDALRARGADRVEIEVFAENDVGRSFYESRGFAVVAEGTETIAGETARVVTYAADV